MRTAGADGQFDAFWERATTFRPYPYQRRLADGLPEVLRAPTGSGKTAAAVLPWLYRRRVGPTEEIRRSTPRRLIVALPMRTLVEQTIDLARQWVASLGLEQLVSVSQLMGGEGRVEAAWRLEPADDAILIGTIDMLLSRALNRGYAMGKGSWPIDFGLMNNDAQWVFDEVQLMGPALPTSRQLQAWRAAIGTYGPIHSMWMSATVDLRALATVDAPAPSANTVSGLQDDDLDHGPLRTRVHARRTIETIRDDEDIATAVRRLHVAGTRTIVVRNTVRRAQDTWSALLAAGLPAELTLVHSRLRPSERAASLRRALSDPGEEGTIVVTTQALEAGVDITSACLITEVAPWSSIVQRAGRCNRYGEVDMARLVWIPAADAAPYEPADLAAAEAALRALDGTSMTGAELAAQPVATVPTESLVIRRKDLMELFDTAPDLSGNDIDVSRFIRDGEQVDVRIAWRPLIAGGTWPDPLDSAVVAPTRNELCPAPIGAVRRAVATKKAVPLWRFDDAANGWTQCRRPADIVPGAVHLADVTFGRYDPARGWDETLTGPVPPIVPVDGDPLTTVDSGAGADRTSATGAWVTIPAHLRHAGEHATALVGRLHTQLPQAVRDAVVRAAQLHDIGKIHPVFQATMRGAAGDHERSLAESGGPWAKSSQYQRSHHSRTGFSHDLAGGLALLHPAATHLLAGTDDTLVRYLVAAHHGRVRLGIRSGPKEARCPEGAASVLGICDGEILPAVETPVGLMPEVALDLSAAHLGGEGSWTAMALALRDREDLGVFRLGFLEAVVRTADWRASTEEAAG